MVDIGEQREAAASTYRFATVLGILSLLAFVLGAITAAGAIYVVIYSPDRSFGSDGAGRAVLLIGGLAVATAFCATGLLLAVIGLFKKDTWLCSIAALLNVLLPLGMAMKFLS